MSQTDRSTRKDRSVNECQSYHYSQSSKVSSISRTIILGIIGTVWVLIYSEEGNGFVLSDMNLLVVVALCFIYLLIDLCHYFCDASTYRKESLMLHPEDECYLDKDIDWGEYESRMVGYTKRSYRWFVAKFISVLAISLYFIFIMGRMMFGLIVK